MWVQGITTYHTEHCSYLLHSLKNFQWQISNISRKEWVTRLILLLRKRQLSKYVTEPGKPSGLILYVSGHTAYRYCIRITWGESCSHSVRMKNVDYQTRLRLNRILPWTSEWKKGLETVCILAIPFQSMWQNTAAGFSTNYSSWESPDIY